MSPPRSTVHPPTAAASAQPAPPAPPPAARRPGLAARHLWALLAVGLLLTLAWTLSPVLLLAFAGTLVALVLLRLAEPLQHRFGWHPRVALVAVVVGLVVGLGGGGWLLGGGTAEQLTALRETLPRALQALRQWVATLPGGEQLIALISQPALDATGWQQLAGLFTGTLNATIAAVGALVLMLAIGVYLAADVQTYRRGFVRLLPPRHRPLGQQALDAASRDLSRWLMGQAVSMAAVGLLTAIGLLAIGMPLVLALSIVAALLEFVPYFGPVITGVLIVAVALTEGEQMAFYAFLVCLAVQQAEAYLVQPLAQRWAVKLPPVLGMLAVLVFGLLFGLAGVLLAVPLMVLTMTLVHELWVRRLERPGP